MTAGLVTGQEWLPTVDGGARQNDGDLWCSYAAVRTLTWLGEKVADRQGVIAFLLSRQNPDGGFAWQRGLPSDVWATYYCAQALLDLGHTVPRTDRLAGWMTSVRSPDGGFAMTPGQPSDIWAIYYATRILTQVVGVPVPRPAALASWLAGTQASTGGLGWQPGSEQADVRACYYGAVAWSAAGGTPFPGDAGRLTSWLRDRQAADGGFAFAPGVESCAWAAFRAVRALDACGARPRDRGALEQWLAGRRLDGGGFERWAGYGQADVWACFSVVGAMDTMGWRLDPTQRGRVAAFVRACQLPGSGFTYRRPDEASDSLATAAALISGAGPDGSDHDRATQRELAEWLRRAQLPYEDGVMYMPGRGAEMRCTLWAVEALRLVGERLDTDRLANWLGRLQNLDGGFGYWHGRGSDLVSTVSAVEAGHAAGLRPAGTIDVAAAIRFLDACECVGAGRSLDAGQAGAGFRSAPGAAAPSLAATAQAARALHLLGQPERARALGEAITAWASPLGGFTAAPRGVPDLVSTYQAVLAQQVLGLPIDHDALRRFVAKVRSGDGFAWSPLSRRSAGPLAGCLGGQLAALAEGCDTALPRLNL